MLIEVLQYRGGGGGGGHDLFLISRRQVACGLDRSVYIVYICIHVYVIERTRGAVGYGGKTQVSARVRSTSGEPRGGPPITLARVVLSIL